MLERLESPIIVERAHFLIAGGLGSFTERRDCAREAVEYLLNLEFTKSPYWDELLLVSGLKDVVPVVNSRTIGKRRLAFCKAVEQEYADAISTLETTFTPNREYYRNLELIAQLLILSKNFKGLEEFEYRLKGVSHVDVPTEESDAFWRTQVLILCGFYMQSKFLEFCRGFFKLERSKPEFLGLLEDRDSESFIKRDELCMMLTVSAIIVTPFDNYDDLLSVENLANLEICCPILVRCLRLLSNTSFGGFLSIWNGSIDSQCNKSLLLAKAWDCARLTMRHKIYFFYLRLSNKLTVGYLSRTLDVAKELVKEEMRSLIDRAHLNFELSGDLIQYKNNHYLSAATSKLKENYEAINRCLQSRINSNRDLRDTIQENIMSNSTSGNAANNETVYTATGENSSISAFDENMDIDEINDISDLDSVSFALGNESLSRASGA